MSNDFTSIRRPERTIADLDAINENAEAVARAKGIPTLDKPEHKPRPIRDAEIAADDDHTTEPSKPAEPDHPKTIADRVAEDLDSRPTPRDQMKYVKVPLPKNILREMKIYADEMDMTVTALIWRALDQYDPLKKKIRFRKADISIKDGRRDR